ncbi:hypothetical protein BCR36DRAFT_346604 [Piromyces finnis]|uniref:TOG domain-containing protein n=1 Tax=Piromyces finnis TaxID=1754191 RepID=A0A1Y1VH66_9FUNG|nr:hypothetical protein BCR36DRAFT_346604 [Piromyces finnis]|eukprot:ORX56049.1 hypothetical protein BCR36DRAFT_346604 [Piromyces finnis]
MKSNFDQSAKMYKLNNNGSQYPLSLNEKSLLNSVSNIGSSRNSIITQFSNKTLVRKLPWDNKVYDYNLNKSDSNNCSQIIYNNNVNNNLNKNYPNYSTDSNINYNTNMNTNKMNYNNYTLPNINSIYNNNEMNMFLNFNVSNKNSVDYNGEDMSYKVGSINNTNIDSSLYSVQDNNQWNKTYTNQLSPIFPNNNINKNKNVDINSNVDSLSTYNSYYSENNNNNKSKSINTKEIQNESNNPNYNEENENNINENTSKGNSNYYYNNDNNNSLLNKISESSKNRTKKMSRKNSVYSTNSYINNDIDSNNDYNNNDYNNNDDNKVYENLISSPEIFNNYFEVLKNNESHWEDKSDAIEQMTHLLNNNKKIFLTNLNELCIVLIECISSLRTSFSKASVIFCEKLFINLGTSMDSKVDIIGGALIKKIGEGNNFITEIIEKALNAMCSYCSWNRTLVTLINSSSQKSSNIRLSIANHMDNVINDLYEQNKQTILLKQTDIIERLLITLINLSSDKISLTRKKAKHSIYILFKPIIDNVFISKTKNKTSFSNPEEILEKEIDKILKKNLSAENKKKLTSIVVEFQSKSLNSFMVQQQKINIISSESNSPIKELDTTETPTTNKKTKKKLKAIKSKRDSIKESDIVDKLKIVYENIESKDWKERNSSIDDLTEIVIQNPKIFKNQKLLFPLFDKIAERGKDTNTKISIHITKSLIKIIEVLKATVDPVLINFVSIYLNNLSSTNKLLQVETLKLINILIDPKYEIDQTRLLKIFSYGILHIPNIKIKELLLEKMIAISSNLFQTKPSIICKHLIPTVIELLKIKKNGIKHSLTKLLRHLSDIYGKQEFENIISSQYIDNYNEICTLIES